MRAILAELGKGFGLLIIAILCMLTGLVAASGAIPDYEVFDKNTLVLIILYMLPNGVFLTYRQMFSSPKYQNLEPTAFKWFMNSVFIAGVLMFFIVVLAPQINYTHAVSSLIVSIPLFYYCYESYKLYQSVQKPASPEDLRHNSFENLIFIPAFLLCMVNFAIGILLQKKITLTTDNAFLFFSYDHLLYAVASVGAIALYYGRQVRAAYIYVAWPLAIVGGGFFAFFAYGWQSAKYVSLAVC